MEIKTKVANKIILVIFFYVVLLVSFSLLVSAAVYSRLLPEDFRNLQIELFKFLAGLGIIFLAAGLVISRAMARSISAPLQQMVKVSEAVVKGDFSKRIESKNKEMEELITVFNQVVSSIEKNKQDSSEQINRIKELDKTKSEFISIAAHQLRTPLSAIKWTFRMMIDGDVGDVTLEQKEFLRRGYITNERMITLVNDLLNVSRIEEGRFGYEFKVASIEEIIESILKTIQPLIAEKNLNFIYNKPLRNLRKANVDSEKMVLALENIFNNAIKYTPPKGKITLTLEEKDNQIVIAVSDTGVGIPQDQLPKLFTKFFRAANVIRLQTDGSGLGLFIAKNIVEKHHGVITIESEESKGTTVKIVLPFIEAKVLSSEEKFGEFIKGF